MKEARSEVGKANSARRGLLLVLLKDIPHIRVLILESTIVMRTQMLLTAAHWPPAAGCTRDKLSPVFQSRRPGSQCMINSYLIDLSVITLACD